MIKALYAVFYADNGLLKVIPDCFVKSKMIKALYAVFYADNGLLVFDEDSGDITFCCNRTGIRSVNLHNINLDQNFEDEPDTTIIIRILA